MASRYLLIEFDEAATADKMLERINDATRAGRSYRAIGYFSKPTPPYCRCGREVTTKAQASTTKRGRKFGWYVCTECKRPSSMISGLVNLIRPRDIIDPQMYEPVHTEYGTEPLMSYPLSLSLLPRRIDTD